MEALSRGELSEKLTAGRPSTDFYFHHLSASTLVSAMAGRAEKNIEDILCIIPRKFPISVILLDEVDGLLGHVASHGEGATMERVTKMFQSIVQGGTGTSVMPDNTFLLATSNMVDEDLKKPWVQRFGHQTFVGPPSTTKELGEIIQRMWIAKLGPLQKRFCSPNVIISPLFPSLSHEKTTCVTRSISGWHHSASRHRRGLPAQTAPARHVSTRHREGDG